MALIVEDGTGLIDSNGYCDIEFVSEYLTDRGRATEWLALSEDEQSSAIIRATDYIEKRFGSLFIGEVLVAEQALSFPRVDLGLPLKIKQATAEYALRATTTSLLVDGLLPAVKREKKKIATLEKEIEYLDSRTINTSSLVSNLPSYPEADLLIEPFLRSRTSGTLYRA
jgi:hypothetical protein